MSEAGEKLADEMERVWSEVRRDRPGFIICSQACLDALWKACSRRVARRRGKVMVWHREPDKIDP